jgi:hypothetical protein
MEAIFDDEKSLTIPTEKYTLPSYIEEELLMFFDFMLLNGYLANDFYLLVKDHKYIVFDFSNFGTIDKSRVKFKNTEKTQLDLSTVRMYVITTNQKIESKPLIEIV